MMLNCLNFLAEVKKRTGAGEVTANYRGGGELFIRVDYPAQKFSYQQVFNINQWLTPEDELNDLSALVESSQNSLKNYGRKPNAQLDSRPSDP
jgi:pantoate kinase